MSIGAFVGALWCMSRDVGVTHTKASLWFPRMINYLAAVPDLTYPITSIFKGGYFNNTIKVTIRRDQPHMESGALRAS